MRLINLTPHPVVLRVGTEAVTLPPSGVVARTTTVEEPVGTVTIQDGLGIPVIRVVYGRLEGVPPPQEGIGYIVSSLAAQAAPERRDLFIPARPIRDEQGRIVAAQALASEDATLDQFRAFCSARRQRKEEPCRII